MTQTHTIIQAGMAPLSITTATLPTGYIGVPYNQTLQATGGTTPYTWSLEYGTLPPGLSLDSDGVINGTPTALTDSVLLVRVTASNGDTIYNFVGLKTIPVPAAQFQGTVRNNGIPMSGCTVSASCWGESEPAGGPPPLQTQTKTDSAGNFTLSVSAGEWSIGFMPFHPAFDPNANNIVLSSGYTMTIADGETRGGIDFCVVNGTGTISGSVVDEAGIAPTQAFVQAYATINGLNYSAANGFDATGHYFFPVIDGVWHVNVWRYDYVPESPFPIYTEIFAERSVSVTGSAIVNFSPPPITPPYETWHGSRFTADDVTAGLTTLTADFDRDGVPNLLEYAFGRDPKAADTTGVTPNVSGGKMRIAFPRDPAATDITYTVQASSNLSTWIDIAQSTGGAATEAINASGCTVSEDGTGLRTVTVTEKDAFTGAERFLRVKVSSP